MTVVVVPVAPAALVELEVLDHLEGGSVVLVALEVRE